MKQKTITKIVTEPYTWRGFCLMCQEPFERCPHIRDLLTKDRLRIEREITHLLIESKINRKKLEESICHAIQEKGRTRLFLKTPTNSRD